MMVYLFLVVPCILAGAGALAEQALPGASALEADPLASILYTCNLSFEADGNAISTTSLEGHGNITCHERLTGATEHRPVKIRALGAGIGVEMAKVTISGGATGIGLSSSPESLWGHYAVTTAPGSPAAIHLSKGAIVLKANVQSSAGVGFDLTAIELEPDGIKTIDKQARNE